MSGGEMTGRDEHRRTRYRALNEAVAEVLFGLDRAGRPVYLLPESNDLDSVVKRAGLISPRGASTVFVDAVRESLHIEEDAANPFREHQLFARVHASAPLDTPYSLGLLVVLSMAADAMHAGQGMAAHNYYGRLWELLSVPDAQRDRLEQAYRKVAEQLWGSLNAWLEAWEGERGVPTAYAVGHRYIGLPMSQALVRQRDRERLVEMFVGEGLPPGYQMAPADMEVVLDGWINHPPSIFSHALRQLWGDSSARERIVAVAALELGAWDGTGVPEGLGSGATARALQVRLCAQLRTFPSAALELGFLVANPRNLDSTTLHLDGSDGEVEFAAVRSAGGVLRLSDLAGIDPGSLVSDGLSVRVDASAEMIRRPRRVVPFRYDELQSAFVEVERVQLGESSMILVADPLVGQVETVLASVARPGWRALPKDTPGVPVGWCVFRDVEVLDRYEGTVRVDLQPLLPRRSVSFLLTGGFSLPGRLRKWSSLSPPEAHATVPNAQRLTLRLHRGSTLGEELLTEEIDGSVAIVPFNGRGLGDGEYLVTLHEDGSVRPIATSVMRLRSSDTPAAELRARPSGLVYEPLDGPLWPLCADTPDGSPAVDGARVPLDSTPVPNGAAIPDTTPRPAAFRAARSRPRVRVGRGLGAESCMQTGHHRMILPPAMPGRPEVRSVEGECETCGLVKRYPTTAGGARRRPRVPRHALMPVDLTTVPPIESNGNHDYSVAFDALCHLGFGSVSDFGRVAGQVDPTALFADVFLRSLETLGHIDVKRDLSSLAVLEFEVTPPTLVPLGTDRLWLVGRASATYLDDLEVVAGAAGGSLERALDRGYPATRVHADVHELMTAVAAIGGVDDLVVAGDPARSLAEGLPVISSVEAALPRVSVPEYKTLERWDSTSASWVHESSLARTGGYRLGGFKATYVLRSEVDLASGTVALANAQLVKHVASLWADDPLVSYHEPSRSVVVPLGADLPPLYGRALALASGQLPVPLPKGRMLQYRDVPRDLATEVFRRMSA